MTDSSVTDCCHRPHHLLLRSILIFPSVCRNDNLAILKNYRNVPAGLGRRGRCSTPDLPAQTAISRWPLIVALR